MAIFRLVNDAIMRLPDTTFADRGLRERADLQRLLRKHIGVIADDLMVIAEECSEWEDSRRRIDLLAVDREANLVVIELKRDEEGGHMELQAIRYAAMVAKMKFERAVEVFQDFLDKNDKGKDAKSELASFLKEKATETDFAGKVRIILVAADFSKELTTTVLWLNERDLDIRCVRLKPHSNGGETIIDAQQLIPLPEAEDYTVRMTAKAQAVRVEGSDRHALRRAFWTEFLPKAARETPAFRNRSPGDAHYIAVSAGPNGLRLVYCVWQRVSGVEFYIDRDVGDGAFNKAVFDYLHDKKGEIEAAYGKPLGWERLDDRRASRLFDDSVPGGIRSPREHWPAAHHGMITAMLNLEKALKPHLEAAVEHATAKQAAETP